MNKFSYLLFVMLEIWKVSYFFILTKTTPPIALDP